MSAALIAQLIVQIGWPAAMKLIEMWQNKQEVTAQEWQDLKATVKQPEDILTQVALAAGLPMDDPKIKELAALISSARQQPS